jgi:DNA polymerase elongation subunit (family B)
LKQDNINEFNKLVQFNNKFFDASLINNKDIAELYYNMNPKQFIYNKNLGWYAYNDNNILLEYGQNSPTQLLNDISNKIHEWLNSLKNSINLTDEAKTEKFKMITKAYNKIGMSSFIKGTIDFLKHLYNIEKLEEKLKFIELTIMISHICNIPYESIYYNTVMNEGAILKYLKREGIVSPNKPTTHNPILKNIKESYAGGYLLEPIPGLYFDVIDLDFTSLYPSIIKSLNLGIETLIGRIKVENNPTYEQSHSLEKLKERNPEEQIVVEKLNKTNYTLKAAKIKIGDLINLIEKNNYTIAASGAIFDTSEQSICSKILQGWFEKREHYRALKKTAGKAEDWANYKLYDLFQHAFKILQNAMYGTYAINGWRYTDGHLICSAGITNSGQRLTQESIDFVNNKINY